MRSTDHSRLWDLFTEQRTKNKCGKKNRWRKAYLEVKGPATSPDLEGDEVATGLMGGGMTARQKGWRLASPTLESSSGV